MFWVIVLTFWAGFLAGAYLTDRNNRVEIRNLETLLNEERENRAKVPASEGYRAFIETGARAGVQRRN